MPTGKAASESATQTAWKHCHSMKSKCFLYAKIFHFLQRQNEMLNNKKCFMPSGGIKMNDKVNFLVKNKKIAFSKKASKKKIMIWEPEMQIKNCNKNLFNMECGRRRKLCYKIWSSHSQLLFVSSQFLFPFPFSSLTFPRSFCSPLSIHLTTYEY